MNLRLAIYGVLGAAVAFGGAFGTGYAIRGKFDDAAEVSTFKQQLRDKDAMLAEYASSVVKLREQIIRDNVQRAQWETTFAQWQDRETSSLKTITKEGQHAEATINPVCWPTPDERRMRNTAIRTYLAGAASVGLGTANTVGSLPAAPR